MKFPCLLLSIGLFCEGCRSFSLSREALPPARHTAARTALFFKTLLDSGWIAEATALFATPHGLPLLAEQRYELALELERLSSMVGKLPITYLRTDSLSPTRQIVWLEADYLHTLCFHLLHRDTTWAITELEYLPWRRPALPIFPSDDE